MADITAAPLERDLFTFELAWTDDTGTDQVQPVTAYTRVPFGQVSGYWLMAATDDKVMRHRGKYNLLRSALTPESFEQFVILMDTALDEKAVDDTVRFLLEKYEQPPARPSQPPKPSRSGRRPTAGGSKAKLTSQATPTSSTSPPGED